MTPTGTVNPGPIIGAANRGNIYDNAAPTPNVNQSLRGWFQPMVVGIVTSQQISKGAPVRTVREVQTAGIMQPGDPEKLVKLAEGNRSWRNFMLHVDPGLGLQTNDAIIIRGVGYIVMESLGYSDYGYDQFELLEGYRNAS